MSEELHRTPDDVTCTYLVYQSKGLDLVEFCHARAAEQCLPDLSHPHTAYSGLDYCAVSRRTELAKSVQVSELLSVKEEHQLFKSFCQCPTETEQTATLCSMIARHDSHLPVKMMHRLYRLLRAVSGTGCLPASSRGGPLHQESPTNMFRDGILIFACSSFDW